MSERIKRNQVFKLQAKLAPSLVELGNSAARSLEPLLVHLVKLRASQINGCAFCQLMHATEARRDGESQQRLDLLAAWREVSIFSQQEKVALHWTETLTRLASQQTDAHGFSQLTAHFTQQQIVDLTTTIATINAWNRIAVGFNFTPEY